MSVGDHVDHQRPVTFGEFSAMREDMTDMKSLMSRMVETMSRISIIEERQHNHAQISEKVATRLEELTERQHQMDVSNAANGSLNSRVSTLELQVRESHVESERNKARFDTVVWLVRALWAVVGSGGLLWLFHAVQATPIPGVK